MRFDAVYYSSSLWSCGWTYSGGTVWTHWFPCSSTLTMVRKSSEKSVIIGNINWHHQKQRCFIVTDVRNINATRMLFHVVSGLEQIEFRSLWYSGACTCGPLNPCSSLLLPSYAVPPNWQVERKAFQDSFSLDFYFLVLSEGALNLCCPRLPFQRKLLHDALLAVKTFRTSAAHSCRQTDLLSLLCYIGGCCVAAYIGFKWLSEYRQITHKICH
jgi:hypothetical protein